MRIVILLLLWLTSITVMGETTVQIPRVYEERKTWTYFDYYPDDPEKNEYYELSVVGDTIINDVVAAKVRNRSLNMERDDYYFAVYEKDGVIYDYFKYLKKFYPKIDFNVKAGDTRPILNPDYMEYYDDIMLVVANDERVSINGKDFRIITIENERHNFLGYWIEGVGMISNFGAASMIDYPLPTCGYYETTLIKCEKDGVCIFSDEDLKKYSGLITVYDDKKDDNIIYDLIGRKVNNPLKGQIYIKGGKKILW